MSADGGYNPDYHRYLVDFMSFRDNTKYLKKHLFSESQLLTIVPEDISRWMKNRLFGDSDVSLLEAIKKNQEKQMPLKLRSSTLMCMKKGISWYMPNSSPWNQLSNFGNPTRSKPINMILSAVRKLEVRRTGKAPTAKRALTMLEFRKLLSMLEAKDDFDSKIRTTTMLKYQYNLISRCDDLGNFLVKDIHSHTDPAFASFSLQTRVRWSKNVKDERDCPDQILLGSGDPDYCVLLGLAVYLECWLIDGNGANSGMLFHDGEHCEGNVKKCKDKYSTKLSLIFKSEEFNNNFKNAFKLGSHSVRKYPATFAKSAGCTLEEIDTRGRWKRNSDKMVTHYVDVKQEFIDGKVAAHLCVGGAVKYELVDGSGLSNNWVNEKVVPGISAFYGREDDNIGTVLGLPLLWAVFDPSQQQKVPGWLIAKVMADYEFVKLLADGTNPVRKSKLVVFPTNEGGLGLSNVPGDCGSEPSATGIGTIRHQMDQLNTIMAQQHQLQQQMATMKEEITNMVSTNTDATRRETEKKFEILNKNVKRLFAQPARVIHKNDNDGKEGEEQNDNNNRSKATDGRGAELLQGGGGWVAPLQNLVLHPER